MEEVEWEGEVGTGLQLIGGIEGRKESRESENMQDKETGLGFAAHGVPQRPLSVRLDLRTELVGKAAGLGPWRVGVRRVRGSRLRVGGSEGSDAGRFPPAPSRCAGGRELRVIWTVSALAVCLLYCLLTI